jgi:hypothetical protein
MSDYVKLATNVGDQYLAALSEAQENYLKAMAPFTKYAAQFPTPPLPAAAADLPTLQEVTEAQFAFAQKWLKQQKKFAEKLYSAKTDEAQS